MSKDRSQINNIRNIPNKLFSGGSNDPPDTTTGGDLSFETNRTDKDSNPLLRWWDSLEADNKNDLKSSLITFSAAIFIRILLIEPRFIPSLSMYPTFDIGDQLLVDKISKVVRPYQRRDVVVFNPSDTYKELTGNKEALIKRIVAVAGDIVEVKDRTLFVNGVPQQEEYINEKPDYALEPIKVPTGFLLVLGDNRNHSFDSHIWGFLPERNIIGRAVLKYWPPWRAGLVEGSN